MPTAATNGEQTVVGIAEPIPALAFAEHVLQRTDSGHQQQQSRDIERRPARRRRIAQKRQQQIRNDATPGTTLMSKTQFQLALSTRMTA